MGTTQRKEQRKMKLEKEIIRLTKLHQNTDKRELIQNINHVLKHLYMSFSVQIILWKLERNKRLTGDANYIGICGEM